MTESVQVARWISQLQDQPWDIHSVCLRRCGRLGANLCPPGWTATEPGSWWALHAFLFQREEGRRNFALLGAIHERFAISIYRAAAGGHCAEAMGLVISEFRTENARVLVSVRGQPSKGQ